MNRGTDNRPYKQRTEEEMRQALQSFMNGTATYNLPPDDTDPDLVLSDAIAELLEARRILAKMEQES